MSKANDAIALQRLILSRWVRMKLLPRHIDVKDVVEDSKDGILLTALLEELSEKKYTGPAMKPQKLRIKQVEQLNNSLDFIWKSGVTMKVKPSAENFLDGDERAVLGLVFAILLKFMKIGDDDEEDGPGMNAKDALLQWISQKCTGYAGIETPITQWKKGMASALPLAAVMHKHRPRSIDYDALQGKSAKDVFAAVQEAALNYFELEKYITFEQFQALDENSLVIYVSEYYYGIAEARKLDLAAKRISKVILFTEENDALRAKYVQNAKEFKERVDKVKVMLEDRTIDNTMAGAKKRIADFYDYKSGDKMKIIHNQLALEGTYNNLAMRLAHNKRPAFQPPAGVALSDVAATMKHLDECEAERKVALHAELNRQIRLAGLNVQHEGKVATLREWKAKKEEYLTATEESWTVAMATLQLRRLDAFDKERATYLSGSVAALKALGAELGKEKFEHVGAVQEREGEVDAFFAQLSELSKAKRPVLDADLAREQEKERLRLEFAQLASDFDLTAQGDVEVIQAAHFGFTLEECEAYQATMDAENQSVKSRMEADKAGYAAVHAKIVELSLGRPYENVYTERTLETLDATIAGVEQAQAQRAAAYAKELERMREDDRLCKEFAATADPFVASLIAIKDGVTGSTAELEDQLAAVQGHMGKAAEREAALQPIVAQQAVMDERGITHNRHTLLTAADAKVQVEQLGAFLEEKEKMLHAEIEVQRRKGLTEEEVAEIESNFDQFAEGGKMSARQFKACSYSLGNELKKQQVKDIMAENGTNGVLDAAAFKQMMINLLGVSITKDDILQSFATICKSEENIDAAAEKRFESLSSEHDQAYIKEHCPKEGDNYKFVPFTEDVFSR